MPSAYLVAGMHFDRVLLRTIFERAAAMEDNVAYQIILGEGEMRHARRMILRRGTAKVGAPTPEQEAKVKRIKDVDRPDRLAVRLVEVDSWAALLRGR